MGYVFTISLVIEQHFLKDLIFHSFFDICAKGSLEYTYHILDAFFICKKYWFKVRNIVTFYFRLFHLDYFIGHIKSLVRAGELYLSRGNGNLSHGNWNGNTDYATSIPFTAEPDWKSAAIRLWGFFSVYRFILRL